MISSQLTNIWLLLSTWNWKRAQNTKYPYHTRARNLPPSKTWFLNHILQVPQFHLGTVQSEPKPRSNHQFLVESHPLPSSLFQRFCIFIEVNGLLQTLNSWFSKIFRNHSVGPGTSSQKCEKANKILPLGLVTSHLGCASLQHLLRPF